MCASGPTRPRGSRHPWRAGAALLAVLGAGAPDGGGEPPPEALEGILAEEAGAHVAALADPALEGRDSPSVGLTLAARHVCEAFAAAGLAAEPASQERWLQRGEQASVEGAAAAPGEPPAWSRPPADGGTYLWPFERATQRTRNGEEPFQVPVPERCALALHPEDEDAPPQAFRYGADFVPLAGFPGDVSGELVWAGYGIQSTAERYDDFRGVDLTDRIALVLEGEPRHRRKFDGEEVTAEAALWNKLDALAQARARGAVLVRLDAPRGDDPERPPLSYRYTWASWAVPTTDRWRGPGVPAVEVGPDCASALLGRDVAELAERIDRTGRPVKVRADGREVSLRSVLEPGPVELWNVLGWLPGADPALAAEVVVVGAHYDHVGVGLRGRVACGADDNASGTAAMLELVQALALAQPRRSVLFCAFAAEEDGLLGSRALVAELPVARERVVAMVNLDMVGRGDAKEVAVMGFAANPGMEKVVRRAQKLARTGVRKLTSVDDPGLFQRSDHASFHDAGIPVVFFLEGYPIEANKDYHTWRDTAERVDADKVAATARLAFLTAWILATDDERLPAPGG